MSNKDNIFLIGRTGKLQKFGTDRLPTQEVKQAYDWVIFGDKEDWENQQPQYYESLYRLSSKNNAILKTKNRYVYGKGFTVDRSPRYKLHDSVDEISLNAFINNVEDSRTFKRLISDRNLYGGFACEMIPSKDGTKVIPYYIPFKNIRISKQAYNKKGELEPTKYYYTSDWSKRKKAAENPDFEIFDEFSDTDDDSGTIH